MSRFACMSFNSLLICNEMNCHFQYFPSCWLLALCLLIRSVWPTGDGRLVKQRNEAIQSWLNVQTEEALCPLSFSYRHQSIGLPKSKRLQTDGCLAARSIWLYVCFASLSLTFALYQTVLWFGDLAVKLKAYAVRSTAYCKFVLKLPLSSDFSLSFLLLVAKSRGVKASAVFAECSIGIIKCQFGFANV